MNRRAILSSRFSLLSPLFSALVVWMLGVGLSGLAQAQVSGEDTRLLLGQGWTFMEHGNLSQAEAAFAEAFETEEGPNTAEVYYATAAVWWERRNGMAAYMWLSDATRAAKKSYTWDGGPDHDWDRRIAARRRFIEANFSVIKLRSPARGKPVPPLADPPHSDPVLAAFSELLPQVVAEGVKAKAAVQWVLIPNGTYWVGEQLVALDSGEQDAAKAATWDLVPDRGKARKHYASRLAELAAGRSPARAAEDKQAATVLAEAERRRQLEERRRAEANEREALALAQRQDLEARRIEADKQAAAEALEAERAAASARWAEVERAEADRAKREDALLAAAQAEREQRDEEARADAERAKREDARLAAAEAEREQRAEEARADAERAKREAARLAAADAEREEREEEARAESERADAERAKKKVERDQEEAVRVATDGERVDAARAEAEKDKPAPTDELAEERSRRREGLVRARSQGEGLSRSSSVGASFADRRMFVAGAVGPALVSRLTADASSVGAEWTATAEVGGLIPLRGRKFSVAVGFSYANLPVSGCSAAQTRSSVVAVHGGVRIPVEIAERIWFAFRGGLHVGAGGSWPDGAARSACGAAKLEGTDSVYGVRLQGTTGSGRLSYSALAWTGYSMVIGPDLDASVFFGLGERRTFVGVGFFLRHDQLLLAVRPDSYHFEVDGGSANDLDTVDISSFDPKVSMARLQLGFRATVMF